MEFFAPTSTGEAPTIGTGAKRTTRSAYDLLYRLVSETSPNGVITAYQYDNVGNRTAKIEAAGTASARRTETRYDATNRVSDMHSTLWASSRTRCATPPANVTQVPGGFRNHRGAQYRLCARRQ